MRETLSQVLSSPSWASWSDISFQILFSSQQLQFIHKWQKFCFQISFFGPVIKFENIQVEWFLLRHIWLVNQSVIHTSQECLLNLHTNSFFTTQISIQFMLVTFLRWIQIEKKLLLFISDYLILIPQKVKPDSYWDAF